jgi:hypothetical protein
MDPTSHEARLLEKVERTLHHDFPRVPPEHVSALIECVWAHYDGAPIRDFVPQLVLKQVREELLHDARSPQPSPPDAFSGALLAKH